MIGERPKFFDSPYFVGELGNWHLKPGAPKEVVDEFNAFMRDSDPAGTKPGNPVDEIDET